jgi:hypothetical protein
MFMVVFLFYVLISQDACLLLDSSLRGPSSGADPHADHEQAMRELSLRGALGDVAIHEFMPWIASLRSQ